MSQLNTIEGFLQLLNATNARDHENEAPKTRNPEDLGAEPSSKGADRDPVGGGNSRQKRFSYTEQQAKALQALFEKRRIPSRKQREDLACLLGLTPLQVRLWFERRRKKWKFESTEHENVVLKAENEKLRAENARYKEALDTPCPKCGGKTTLDDDMKAIFDITSKYVREPSASTCSHLPSSSRSPYPSQTHLAPMEPTPIPSAKGDVHHHEWTYPDDEVAVMMSQFRAKAPKP